MNRWWALLVVAVNACNNPDLHKFARPGTEAEARSYIGLLGRGEIDSAIARIHPSLLTPDAKEQISGVAALLADQQSPDSAELIGVHQNTEYPSGATTDNLSFQFSRGGRWLLANAMFRDSAGVRTVVGINAYQTKG